MHTLGLVLIFFGAIFLLKNLGIISATAWEVLWPLLLVLVGISFLKRSHEHAWSKWCPGCSGWLDDVMKEEYKKEKKEEEKEEK